MPAPRGALTGIVLIVLTTLALALAPSSGAQSSCPGATRPDGRGGYRGNHKPVARFTFAWQRDGSVAFDASSSTDADGDPITYTWAFGDGANEVPAAPQTAHTFPRPQRYHVTLTVKDCAGGEGTTYHIIDTAPPPVTVFAINDALGRSLAGLTVGPMTGLLHDGFATELFDSPGVGKIAFDWFTTVAKKQLKVAHGAQIVVKGPASVKVRLNRAGRKLLRRHTRLKVQVRATFTHDFKPRSMTRGLTLRR